MTLPGDGPEQDLALIARTLQITPELWRRFVDAYRATLPPAPENETVDDELARVGPVLRASYLTHSPHESAVPTDHPGAACPACGTGRARAVLARQPGPLLYGRCDFCGHGVLLSAGPGTGASTPYGDARYFEGRTEAGVGYDAYAAEADYRERKGAALVARLTVSGAPVRRLLEIGSGFGFTRVAAERAGITTAGVDLNPAACAEARRRYGLDTFRGTLREALDTPDSGIAPHSWDAVIYQFVLEHVVDPVDELNTAREALRLGGCLALLVPSMEAFELDVFGASYRSLRADHLHLMTRASLRALLGRAGFVTESIDSHCNLHLLRGLLSDAALARIYETGRGPDFRVLARSER